jgi:hypothetical protein
VRLQQIYTAYYHKPGTVITGYRDINRYRVSIGLIVDRVSSTSPIPRRCRPFLYQSKQLPQADLGRISCAEARGQNFKWNCCRKTAQS